MSAAKFLWVACFWPLLINVTGSASQSQIIFVSIFFTFAVLVMLSKPVVYVPYRYVLPILFTAIVLLLSSLVNQLSIARVISDVSRFLMLIFFIVFGYNARVECLESFSKSLLWISLAQIAFSCLVYFSFAWPLLDYFKARLSSDPLPFHFFRFSGALGFPTEFSFFLLIGLAITGHRFLHKPSQVALVELIPFTLLSAGILLSVSRSGLLAATLLLILLYLHFFRSMLRLRLRERFLLPTLLLTVLGVAIWLASATFGEAERLSIFGYLSVSNGFDDSVLHRFKELECGRRSLLGDVGVRSDICGLGVIESTFGFFLVRHGGLGLLAMLCWLIGVFYLMRILFKADNALSWSLAVSLLAYLVTYAPFSEVIMRSKGIVIYGVILGVALQLVSRQQPGRDSHHFGMQ